MESPKEEPVAERQDAQKPAVQARIPWHTPTFRSVTIDSVTGSYFVGPGSDLSPGYHSRS